MAGTKLLRLLGVAVTFTKILRDLILAVTDNDVGLLRRNKSQILQHDLQHWSIAHPDHCFRQIAANLLQAFTLTGSRHNSPNIFHFYRLQLCFLFS